MATLGIKLSSQGCSLADLRAVWRIADDAGFDHLWGFDHLAPIFTDEDEDVLEGMTLLAAMAEATSRVRIGLLVTANTYRHPALVAKMATTIDHLSDGRLEFGIGASGAEAEHTMLGIPFGSASERIRQLDEALTVVRSLWTDDRTTFAGRHYHLTDAVSLPKPVQRPCPPIWVGGAGEQLTLRVVARHADVWNVIGSVEEAARKASILDEHCTEVGRDPAAVRRSVQPRFDHAEPNRMVDLLHEYRAAGFTDNVVYVPPGTDPVRAATIAAEQVLPHFAAQWCRRQVHHLQTI
jgi:F420-dependent oxidoreductase-like protein